MSRWVESFESHELVSSWSNLTEVVDSERLDEKTTESVAAEIARIRKVVGYLDSVFDKIDPELAPVNVLNNMGKHVNACVAEVNHFLANSNSGHLTNANAQLDNLILVFNQLPASNLAITKQEAKNFITGYSSTFSAALKRFNSDVEKSLQSVTSEFASVQETLNERREELKELTSQLKTTEQTIQKQTAEFNSQFQSSEKTRSERFDQVVNEYSDDADKEFEELATKTSRILEVLSTLQANAQEVYDVTINTLQAGAYSGYANEERKKANWLSFIASVLFIVGTAALVAPEVVRFFSEEEYVFSFQSTFYRVGTSIILFVPAFYFAKESTRHRTNEIVNRRRQHILTTLDPYTKLMDPKKAEELKIHVAKTVFSDINTGSGEGEEYQSMIERLKALIDRNIKT